MPHEPWPATTTRQARCSKIDLALYIHGPRVESSSLRYRIRTRFCSAPRRVGGCGPTADPPVACGRVTLPRGRGIRPRRLGDADGLGTARGVVGRKGEDRACDVVGGRPSMCKSRAKQGERIERPSSLIMESAISLPSKSGWDDDEPRRGGGWARATMGSCRTALTTAASTMPAPIRSSVRGRGPRERDECPGWPRAVAVRRSGQVRKLTYFCSFLAQCL
jgi:hypothetical protein